MRVVSSIGTTFLVFFLWTKSATRLRSQQWKEKRENFGKEIEALQQENAAQAERIEGQREAINQRNLALNDLEAQINQLQAQLADAQQAVEQSNQEVAALNVELGNRDTLIAGLEADKVQLEENIVALDQQVADLVAQIEANAAQFEEDINATKAQLRQKYSLIIRNLEGQANLLQQRIIDAENNTGLTNANVNVRVNGATGARQGRVVRRNVNAGGFFVGSQN